MNHWVTNIWEMLWWLEGLPAFEESNQILLLWVTKPCSPGRQQKCTNPNLRLSLQGIIFADRLSRNEVIHLAIKKHLRNCTSPAYLRLIQSFVNIGWISLLITVHWISLFIAVLDFTIYYCVLDFNLYYCWFLSHESDWSTQLTSHQLYLKLLFLSKPLCL
jgi:hypothetical protein